MTTPPPDPVVVVGTNIVDNGDGTYIITGLDNPYGADVTSVRRLIRDVTAEGVRPATGGVPPAPRVGDGDISAWILEATSLVAIRIRRYLYLPANTDDTAGGYRPGRLTQADVVLAAKHLVELYAASLATDVNHPERQSQYRGSGGAGMGAVLYRRYLDELASLETAIDAAVAPGGDIPNPVDVVSAAAVFPQSPFPPSIRYGGPGGVVGF